MDSDPRSEVAQHRTAIAEAQRMTGFDSATWRTATSDPLMRSTIVGALVLASVPDMAEVTERFERVSRVVPALRQRIVSGDGLSTPHLAVDPDFDLTYHLVHLAAPAGTGWGWVLDEARAQSMADFDHDRPLWRATVLDGLPHGKAVLLLKVHHAIVDGEGLMLLLANLVDFTDPATDPGPMPEAPTADALTPIDVTIASGVEDAEHSASVLHEFVHGVAPATLTALRHPRDTVERIASTAASLATAAEIPTGPMSPIMRERSSRYQFGTLSFPFAAMKERGKAGGHTVNDVFLAGVAEGLGEYHVRHDAPVEALRVNLPISLRTADSGTSNAVTIARFALPIAVGADHSDELMSAIGAEVKAQRAEPALAYTEQLADVSRLIPTEVLAAAMRASDVTASNVPGVPIPVWLAGVAVQRMYPLVATVGAGTNITLLTFDGLATVGVSTDDAAIEDHDVLMDSLRAGFSTVLGVEVVTDDPFEV